MHLFQQYLNWFKTAELSKIKELTAAVAKLTANQLEKLNENYSVQIIYTIYYNNLLSVIYEQIVVIFVPVYSSIVGQLRSFQPSFVLRIHFFTNH